MLLKLADGGLLAKKIKVFNDYISTALLNTWRRPATLDGGAEEKDGVIGRPAFKCWRLVLRFRLMAIRGHRLNGPQASEGEAQHGAFCRIGRIGQGDQRLHCG
jgi:hypothetical protein